nr:ATP-binding protein [Desulfobacterales bacterium]
MEQYYVEVSAPTIEDVKADQERFLAALKEAFGLRHLCMDRAVIQALPRQIRSGEEGLTALIRDGREIIGLQGETEQRLYGIAFDMGTTTVVGYLMDLLSGEGLSVVSAMNPQIPYGDDVISRISFCQKEVGGLEKLSSRMVQCLNGLIIEAASQAGINPSQIMEMTVVGNTAMHHIFLGLETRHLAMAPYTPVLSGAQDEKALDLGIEIGPSAYVHFLPLKAGFLGSDAIACTLATGIHRKKTTTLLIDLGTNGEIVLGNRERLVCCSTAAGPAFEG